MKNYRIMFVRDGYRVENNKILAGNPVGCVAMRVVQDGKQASVEFQISTVNPLDRFDRAVSRELAIGRMIDKPYFIDLPTATSAHDISAAVMRAIAEHSGFPTKMRKGAKLWQKYYLQK